MKGTEEDTTLILEKQVNVSNCGSNSEKCKEVSENDLIENTIQITDVRSEVEKIDLNQSSEDSLLNFEAENEANEVNAHRLNDEPCFVNNVNCNNAVSVNDIASEHQNAEVENKEENGSNNYNNTQSEVDTTEFDNDQENNALFNEFFEETNETEPHEIDESSKFKNKSNHTELISENKLNDTELVSENKSSDKQFVVENDNEEAVLKNNSESDCIITEDLLLENQLENKDSNDTSNDTENETVQKTDDNIITISEISNESDDVVLVNECDSEEKSEKVNGITEEKSENLNGITEEKSEKLNNITEEISQKSTNDVQEDFTNGVNDEEIVPQNSLSTDIELDLNNEIDDEEGDDTEDETTVKLKKAVKVAMKELLHKVLGPAKPEQIQSGTTENADVSEKDEDKEMQNVTKIAICGLFKNSTEQQFPQLNNTSNINSNFENLQEKPTLIQHIIESAISATSKTTIASILDSIKALQSAENFLLYLKLSIKVNKQKISTESETNTKEIELRNSKIEKILSATISDSAKSTIDDIMTKINVLKPTEYLFLHLNLPKCKKISPEPPSSLIRCSPIVSQSIMWLKSCFEENPFAMTPKQNVYLKYQSFCQKNKLKPLGTSDFGKMIKRVYPNLMHRRQIVNGKSHYNYGGLRYRFQLPPPSLPKISIKPKLANNLLTCNSCCEVYGYMHNLARFNKPKVTKESTNSNKRPSHNKVTPNKVRNSAFLNDDDGSYKSDVVDGKSILVHDPLELLSVAVKEKSRGKKEVVNEKLEKRKLVKVKYKQYRHPSIKKLCSSYENLILPYDVYKHNVNPIVSLDNQQINNWCAMRIKQVMKLLKNLDITHMKGTTDIIVNSSCCGYSTEKTQYFKKELITLKERLANVKLKRDSNGCDFKIIYKVDDKPSHNASSVFGKIIVNVLKNKHPSIENLFTQYKNINVPEEILKVNINPIVTLDRNAVLSWYQQQICNLKKQQNKTKTTVKIVPESIEVAIPPPIPPPPPVPSTTNVSSRQSRAKMMNFCEIDFSDSDDDFLSKYNLLNMEPIIPKVANNVEVNVSKVKNRKRSASDEVEVVECVTQPKKKTYPTDISLNNPVELLPPTPVVTFESPQFICSFCLKDFTSKKELFNHEKIHFRCRSCNCKFKNAELMRNHLIRHCSVNNALNAPLLKLHRVDTVELIVNRYHTAFKEANINVNVTRSSAARGIKIRTMSSFAKQPKTYQIKPKTITYQSIGPGIKPTLVPIAANSILNRENPSQLSQKTQINIKQHASGYYHIVNEPVLGGPQIMENQPILQRQAPFQLKNTISNNLNKILLLSTNNIQQKPSSPKVVYSLYLNNVNTPYQTINSDCALNTIPSCSTSSESTNFMQIVETPNPPLIQYSPQIPETVAHYEHNDHSYHQQPIYITDTNIPRINNINEDDLPRRDLDIPFINCNNLEASSASFSNSFTTNTNEIASTNTPPAPLPGPFRIRVKDIRELS